MFVSSICKFLHKSLTENALCDILQKASWKVFYNSKRKFIVQRVCRNPAGHFNLSQAVPAGTLNSGGKSSEAISALSAYECPVFISISISDYL